MYKVTLSMPIYNVAPYVEHALLSALNQTFDSIEFLIVDDRGTDNSMDIVRKIVAEHPRGKDVRIIEHPHNIGTGATKNTAIDNAQGEYLFFMDSDDEITPDCIHMLYKEMVERPVDFVAGSHKKIHLDTTDYPFQYENIRISGRYALAYRVYKERKQFSLMTWNKLYSINYLRENDIRCFPNHINEDAIFSNQIIISTISCSLISYISYYYKERRTSTEYLRCNNFSERNTSEYVEIYDFYKKNFFMFDDKKLRFYYLSWIIASVSLVLIHIRNSSVLSLRSKKTAVSKICGIKLSIHDVIVLLVLNFKNIYYWILIKSPYSIKIALLKLYSFK